MLITWQRSIPTYMHMVGTVRGMRPNQGVIMEHGPVLTYLVSASKYLRTYLRQVQVVPCCAASILGLATEVIDSL